MIRIVNGDLLSSDATYICHQVNCMGVMGSGVAAQIKARWPKVYTEYKGTCDAIQAGSLLGYAQEVLVDHNKFVCNLFGQLNYGRDGSSYTKLSRLKKACELMVSRAEPDATFAMPYRIGCGLGGGNWGDTLDMLAEVFADRDLTLYRMV